MTELNIAFKQIEAARKAGRLADGQVLFAHTLAALWHWERIRLSSPGKPLHELTAAELVELIQTDRPFEAAQSQDSRMLEAWRRHRSATGETAMR